MARNENEPENDAAGQTIAKLRTGLDGLDQLYPVNTPDLEWFHQITVAEKQRLRKKFARDLLWFWIVAAALLSVYLVAFNHLPVRSIALVQVVATVLPIVALIGGRRWLAGDPHDT